MAWKSKKQKELTPEEAIALAKKDLAPYWHRVSPQFAGVRTEKGVSIIPLEPMFTDGVKWLLVFGDPTDLTGESAVVFSKECHRRYQIFGMKILLVLKAPFAFLSERAVVENYMEHRGVQFAVVLDYDRSITEAFGVGDECKAVLLTDQGKQWESSGTGWMDDAERKIQTSLRADDPGLPLLPVARPPESLPTEGVRIDFGRSRGVEFPVPGFTISQGDFFLGEFPEGGSATMIDGVPLAIHGKWAQDADRIATSDPNARLSIHAPYSDMSIVAQPLKGTVDGAKITIEVNGIPAPDLFADDDLSYDEEGRSVVRVRIARLYKILKALSARERNITLSFPTSAETPVAIFGIRFWGSGSE